MASCCDPAEYQSMRKKFIFSCVFSIPLFILSMGMWAPAWLQLILATPVVFWAASPFFKKAWESIKSTSYNMFTLIALGVGATYLYSVVATVFPFLFPENHMGHADVYFEAASTIVSLVLLGQMLELKARAKTNEAITALLDLTPKAAKIITPEGKEKFIPLAFVKVGDRLRISPGEKIAVDGVVIEGESSVNESLMTGESLPVLKKIGNSVIGGTVNGTGTMIIQATHVGSEMMLSRIVRLVEDAQSSRAPIQKLADTIARYFVPAVVMISLLTLVYWFRFGCAQALINAVSVLMIACPCALGLATPVSMMMSMGRGARMGVLFKSAEAIEVLQKVDVVVVDKTGTLTEGQPQLASMEVYGGLFPDDLLRLAASLESLSEHPLSRAIVEAAQSKNLVLEKVENFQSITGQGVKGNVGGQEVMLGNALFMNEKALEKSNLMREKGQTILYMALNQKVVGFFGVADPIKENAQEAIQSLQKENLKIVMMTGDNLATAQAIGSQLQIDQIFASLLPQQKLEKIKELQAQGHHVAMMGDGINDAPALAQADVGIAMGTGTDVAIESAGVTLLKGDLSGLVRARRLSRKTMTNIKQNLFLAFIYNIIGIPIAAGVLYPTFGILLSPMLASAAMSLSSLSVIGNALRLRK